MAWPQPAQSARVTVPGPAGGLDTLVEAARDPADAVAIVCHPHPQHGGSKDNKVVFTLARAARAVGCDSLRFDFRGVGSSGGGFDDGVGEVDDTLAMCNWARRESGRSRWLLLGFSFGAAVALRAAMRETPQGLVTVALPTAYFQDGLPRPDCPWQAVHGGDDEVADAPAAIAALQRLPVAPELAMLDGAGHFFHGRLTELRERVTAQLQTWLDG